MYPNRYGGRYHKDPLWKGSKSGTGKCVYVKLLFSCILIPDTEEDKRVLCQLLNKLHIPDVVDDHKIRSLKLLMDNLRAVSPHHNLPKAIKSIVIGPPSVALCVILSVTTLSPSSKHRSPRNSRIN